MHGHLTVKLSVNVGLCTSRRCAGYFLPFIERHSVLLTKSNELRQTMHFLSSTFKKSSVKTSGTSQYTNEVLL